MNEKHEQPDMDLSGITSASSSVTKDGLNFTTDSKWNNYTTRERISRPLNRRERRAQDRQMKKVLSQLERAKESKASNLSPEEQLAVKKKFLEKVREANKQFETTEGDTQE